VVLKVNGGANSGHTAAGIKLNLLPSGVVEREVQSPRDRQRRGRGPAQGALGGPVPSSAKGYAVYSRLLLDERTLLVSDLTHRLLDLAWEDYRVNVLAEAPRGSTGRGITPAYLDEVGQWQITFSDFLAGKNYFARKLSPSACDRALRTIEHVCRVANRHVRKRSSIN
jgi:adenylosuccinate synthase